MHLFNYSWYSEGNGSGNRTDEAADGVARDYGEGVYSESIKRCTCPQLYTPDPTCVECCKPENLIDLRDIPAGSLQAGERIVGDLKKVG